MAKDKKQSDQESSEQSAKKKSGKGKWILLGLVVLVLAGGGFAAYTYFLTGGQTDTGRSGSATPAEASKQAGQEEATMVSLPNLLVNLADPLGKRYLKMGINLEVRGEKAKKTITKRMPRVKDTLILLLSSKTYDELSSMDDKLALKSQIAERLNQIVEGSVVKRVYFTEFIIQ